MNWKYQYIELKEKYYNRPYCSKLTQHLVGWAIDTLYCDGDRVKAGRIYRSAQRVERRKRVHITKVGEVD